MRIMMRYVREKLLEEAQSWIDKLGDSGLKNKITDGYHTFGEINLALFGEVQ